MFKLGYLMPIAGLLLVACTTAYRPLQDANIGTVPAKAMVADYRLATLQANPKDLVDGRHNPILCAEPSPDIARTFTQAISGSLSADVAKSSGADTNASAAFQYQTAQAIAQLGKRYATVQILRDILHDQCMQYANGTLSESTWALMQSRFNSLVVTLLSIEMVSGDTASTTTTPKAAPAPASGASSTDTGSKKGDAQKGTTSPVQQYTKTESAVALAQRNYRSLSVTSKQIDVKAKAATAAASSASAPAGAASQAAALSTAGTTVDAATSEFKDANTALTAAWADIQKKNGVPDNASKALITTFKGKIPASDDAKVKAATAAASAVATTESKKAVTAIASLSKSLSAAATQFDALSGGAKSDDTTTSGSGDDSKSGKTDDGSSGGKISDAQANAIVSIHNKYIGNEDLGPSLLACFTYLDPPGAPRPAGWKADPILTQYCEAAFKARLAAFSQDHTGNAADPAAMGGLLQKRMAEIGDANRLLLNKTDIILQNQNLETNERQNLTQLMNQTIHMNALAPDPAASAPKKK